MPNVSPTCPCGHDKTHPLVHLVASYSALGWLWLFAGASKQPKSAAYTCRRCKTFLEETRDPAILSSLR